MNDLYDAAFYEQANPFILTRFMKHVLTQGLEAWQDNSREGDQVLVASSYRYPISVAINNTDLKLTFFYRIFPGHPLAVKELKHHKVTI